MTARVETLPFPPQEPVDTIFSKIGDLAQYANTSIIAFQKINMAYIHFQGCRIYKLSLTRWDESGNTSKTWLGFKEHFRAAHEALKRTGALTLQETFNQATVANMVQAELQLAFM